MLTISAVYVGVAVAALKTAACYARERVPTALGKPIAELESIQRQLGQAELKLQQARMILYHNAELWDRHPECRAELGMSVAVAKVTATNAAIDAVDHCMRVAGGASMTRNLPLERYYRDVRGGLTHPVNDDQALIMLGRHALSNVVAADHS
jgi:alkylation response protein AidB-like acyl-CoA dehydrogenase